MAYDCQKFEFIDLAKRTPEDAVRAVLNKIERDGTDDVIGVSIVRANDRASQFSTYEIYVVTQSIS